MILYYVPEISFIITLIIISLNKEQKTKYTILFRKMHISDKVYIKIREYFIKVGYSILLGVEK